jgi:hypothetical protein
LSFRLSTSASSSDSGPPATILQLDRESLAIGQAREAGRGRPVVEPRLVEGERGLRGDGREHARSALERRALREDRADGLALGIGAQRPPSGLLARERLLEKGEAGIGRSAVLDDDDPLGLEQGGEGAAEAADQLRCRGRGDERHADEMDRLGRTGRRDAELRAGRHGADCSIGPRVGV